MQNINITIPDDVATDLTNLATVSGFDDAGGLVSDYIVKTIQNFRSSIAMQQAQVTAQANIIKVDPTQIVTDVTEVASPPVINPPIKVK